MIVDCAVYRAGRRQECGHEASELRSAVASLGPDDFIWIGINDPQADELDRVAEVLDLHPLAVEDALKAHQRPKVEQYSDHHFVSLRTISYSPDELSVHEVNAFLAQHYLLTVRHGGPSISEARDRAPQMIELLSHGPTAALYSVIDAVVDGYEVAAAELETDVEEVESSVFAQPPTTDTHRIYRLKRETLKFRRAVHPLREPVARLAQTAEPSDARPYFRDIADHLNRAAESIDAIDHLLDNALNAHLAQLSVQQNADMRKLTAGATIFAVPTAIAGIYGMNFEHMPELDWSWGYPACLAVTAALCGGIWTRFRRAGWL